MRPLPGAILVTPTQMGQIRSVTSNLESRYAIKYPCPDSTKERSNPNAHSDNP
jgi:hypothetical protein